MKDIRSILLVGITGLLALRNLSVAQTSVSTGSMTVARKEYQAVLLKDGRVLAEGGYTCCSVAYYAALANTDVYDPSTGTWTQVSNMAQNRHQQTATLLNDGTVLVSGGANGYRAVASAEVFDPTTNSFTATTSMSTPRFSHIAVKLKDGRVLVAGGVTGRDTNLGYDPGSITATAELYDPTTKVWTAVGGMAVARQIAAATLLADGTVLIAGGATQDGGYTNTAEIFDPKTLTFHPTRGVMTSARGSLPAITLASGSILLAGGYSSLGTLSTAEIYSPATSTFTATANTLLEPQATHAGVALPDGRALIIAGANANIDIFNPLTNSFTSGGMLLQGRAYPNAVLLLPNGQVLVSGGEGSAINGYPNFLSEAELYTPPVLQPIQQLEITLTTVITNSNLSAQTQSIMLSFIKQLPTAVAALTPTQKAAYAQGAKTFITAVQQLAATGKLSSPQAAQLTTLAQGVIGILKG